MTQSPGKISLLLKDIQSGHSDAIQELMPLVYVELRRIAGARMRRERPWHTLQPTALVHEAYVKLVDKPADYRDRAHFFGIAARIMRQVLVDHARAYRAAKRGAGCEIVALDEQVGSPSAHLEDVLVIDEALSKLESLNVRQRHIVEMRFFAGMTIAEMAEVLNVSESTIKNDWVLARMWLHRFLAAHDSADRTDGIRQQD